MSTGLPPGAVPNDPNDPDKPAAEARKIDYLVVYGHSNLLYWWPVWLVAFILAAVTYMEGQQMAVVPDGTEVRHDQVVDGTPREVLVAPPDKSFGLAPGGAGGMTVSSNNNLGVIFVATLFVVAIASTILLRGLVSVIALVVMILTVVTFAYLGWWDDVLLYVGRFDIRMNAAGYMAVAVPLFLAWLFVVCLYDRQRYIIFDSGQIRHVHDVGESEVAIQSEGAIVEKKRNDVFRHWLLGLGTGDLVIRIGGPTGHSIELENVLWINRKLPLIQRMVKEKAITVEAA
jgi:hypothetical protein